MLFNTSNETDLVTTSEEEFDYTLIGMDTQPRTIPSEWTDNGRDPTQILSEIGDPISIETKPHETHDENHSDLSDDTISEESNYEKQKAKQQERPDLLDHIALNQNRTSQNLTTGQKEIRPQLVSNNTTPKDPLEISAQYNEN